MKADIDHQNFFAAIDCLGVKNTSDNYASCLAVEQIRQLEETAVSPRTSSGGDQIVTANGPVDGKQRHAGATDKQAEAPLNLRVGRYSWKESKTRLELVLDEPPISAFDALP
jgi:hypothetical protein